MLDSLNFVKGAVSKKDLVPALTHFHISNGRISGYNGRISLSAPIAFDVDCCPQAEPFIRAIEACTETAQMHLTPAAKLSVRSGKFRAHVNTIPAEDFPVVKPEGEPVTIKGELLPALQCLFNFIGKDASRPWGTGILFDGSSAFATNNVILAEHWLGYHFPYKVVVPRYAVEEMLRIGEEPMGIQLTAQNITFHYSGERWLRSQTVSNLWPDVREMFKTCDAKACVEISEEFWEALATLKPFIGEWDRVYLRENLLCTQLEEGASVEVESPGLAGIYNHKMLSMLQGVAQRIDWAGYPSRVAWYGDNLRGLIIGMRDEA